MENEAIMTLDELSAYLKIPKGTLYKLCENGSLPTFKVGKQLRFRKDDIEKWIATRTKRQGKKR